jgi:glycosyltransferase involved in cell wall biosynthesis
MRVLHLWDNYAPGLFDRSFEICHEEGIDARLVCMNFIGRSSSRTSGVAVVRASDHETGHGGKLQRAAARLRSVVDRRRFRRLVREEIENFDPDVIHVHYGTTVAALGGYCDALSTPFIISFYGFDISQGARVTAIRSAYERAFRRRPMVHVLCDEARDRVLGLGADPKLVVDANLPLPIEQYPDLGSAAEGPFRWLIPARFVEKKGHAFALAAFKKHLDRHPDDLLTCWGYGDDQWLRDLIARLGLPASVEVVRNGSEGPFHNAFVRRLHDYDAILTPSVRSSRGDDEAGPALTTVLAQAAGKPVIVSDFPGHERSVADGVEGIVVPQGNVDALVDAMKRLSADRTRAAAMGKAGRQRARREFAESSYRKALLGWYKLLASEPRTGEPSSA